MSALITAVTAEPVSLVEAKLHLRVTGTDEDSRISSLITAARDYVEKRSGRALVLQTREEVLADFPDDDYIKLYRPPLRSITSLKYKDSAGTETTWAASNYIVDTDSEPGRLALAYGISWPSYTPYPVNAVRVRYRCGYAIPFTATASTDVIAAAGHPYADGDIIRLWNTGGALPAGLTSYADTVDVYARDVVAGVSLKVAATSGGTAIDITGTGTGTHFIGDKEKVRPYAEAMLLLISYWYENREAAGDVSGAIEFGVSSLICLDGMPNV